MSVDPELKNKLQEEGLRYLSDQTPGFFRQKIGKKFVYYNLEGNKISGKKTLDRIKKLTIPPAWQNVWISPLQNSHLQATGVDERGRKQYIYHPDWIKISQENKFDRVIDFGLKLPKIRNKVSNNLRRDDLDKEKILATVIWLLEHTFIRVGNDEYASENHTFGLTTLQNRHVKVVGSNIYFSFKGKSGVAAEVQIAHPVVAKTIRRCIELPGFQLFQFIDEEGSRHVVDSEDVNLFLKEVTKGDYSAKDFRTWGATSLSANNFFELGDAENEKSLKKNITSTVKKVAKHLNNTAAVCRNYYIHPTVINTYQNSILVPHYQDHQSFKKNGLSWDEYALIRLLQKYPL